MINDRHELGWDKWVEGPSNEGIGMVHIIQLSRTTRSLHACDAKHLLLGNGVWEGGSFIMGFAHIFCIWLNPDEQ